MNKKALVVPVEVALEGFYDFVAIRPDGSRRVLATNCGNLITDNGLDYFGNSPNGAFMGVIQVGSGNTAPTFSDTALATFVAQSSTVSVNQTNVYDAANGRVACKMTIRFAAGVAAGNLTEVGMKGTNSLLTSRALITDTGGAPTTVTVEADEILDVTYTLYIYIPADVTGSFNMTINGVVTAFDYIVRPCMVGNSTDPSFSGWGWVFGQSVWFNNYTDGFENNTGGLATADITASVTGYNTNQNAGWSSSSIAAYTNGNHYKDATFVRDIGLATMDIKSLWCRWRGAAFQMSFTPTWQIDSTKKFTFIIRLSWARA